MGFKVNTKKSIFKPIEIEIDGKVYEIKKITTEILEEVSKYEEEARQGKIGALVRQLVAVSGGAIPESVAKKIDIRDIIGILDYISKCIYNPEKVENEVEKKKENIRKKK